MIPSHWFRQITLIVFVMEVAGGILWVIGRLSTNPATKPMTQALGSLVSPSGFYTSAPLSVRFLAPRPSWDIVLQERLARIVATVPDSRPIFLYNRADKEANTAGLLPSHSHIYVTTGLLASMSDKGMRGMITYENAHVRERHIFATFAYAYCLAVSSHLLDNNNFFFAVFLLFLGIRRYCEYRANVDAAQPVGREAMLTVLHELAMLYPSKSWARWFSLANAYPALAMRMRAVETG